MQFSTILYGGSLSLMLVLAVACSENVPGSVMTKNKRVILVREPSKDTGFFMFLNNELKDVAALMSNESIRNLDTGRLYGKPGTIVVDTSSWGEATQKGNFTLDTRSFETHVYGSSGKISEYRYEDINPELCADIKFIYRQNHLVSVTAVNNCVSTGAPEEKFIPDTVANISIAYDEDGQMEQITLFNKREKN